MNPDIKSFHILKAIYSSMTDNRSNNFKIISEEYDQSITIKYNYRKGGDMKGQAIRWLTEHGFKIVGTAKGIGCRYIISDTFKPLKKEKIPKEKRKE